MSRGYLFSFFEETAETVEGVWIITRLHPKDYVDLLESPSKTLEFSNLPVFLRFRWVGVLEGGKGQFSIRV